jgi:DNA-binding MarR family transcriptional regulator
MSELESSGHDRRQPVMIPSQQPNTGTLLLDAFQAFNRELFSVMNTAGHKSLRSKHGAVLANLETRGTRATLLARRAGIGTSAMGEVVDELERLGYVVRKIDPNDRRAKLVVPTHSGVEVTKLAVRTIRKIERRYLKKLGQERYHEFRKSLTDLAHGAFDVEALSE